MASWSEFLQASGGKQDERFGVYFSELTQEACQLSDIALIDAGHLGVISIAGPDALTFLQGQMTCDVREVTPTEFRLGAWCSAKGRVQTSFWLAQAWDQYLLIMDRSLIESIQSALKKYILFSKASMTVRTDLISLGWVGKADEMLQQLELSAPESKQSVSNENSCVINLGNRYLILTPQELAEKLWRLSAKKLGNNSWKLLDIRAGIPQIELKTKDLFLPQNLNFDLIDGVNFKKGCYIGQEIVARLHWKGQAKNRAMHFVTSALSLEPGNLLHDVNVEGVAGRALGEVISRAVNENNELEFLLNVRLDQVQNTLTISENPSATAGLLTLPYAIPNSEATHS